ncbi:MAG: hypothetical protein V1835_05870, partial [Candidatus Micrarchaeota archaeon]
MFKEMFNKLVIVLLVIVVLFGAYLILNSMKPFEGPKPQPSVQIATVSTIPPASSPSPAKLEVAVITVPECADCFNVDAFVFALQQNGADLKIQKYSHNSTEGADLVKKYKIMKLPTLIMSGETSKIDQLDALLENAAENVDGKWVLRDISPPYLDTQTSKIVGMLSIKTILEPSCVQCKKASVPVDSPPIDVLELGSVMKQIGVGILEDAKIYTNTSEGKALVEKYNITMLPAIIISKDIDAYEAFKTAFLRVGTAEMDGVIVTRALNPPFFNVTTGKEEGLLTIAYIKPGDSCTDCYDYNMHTQALAEIGVVPIASLYYDYDSLAGANYTKEYNLTKFPVMLLSPEIRYYPAFMMVSNQIGGFEKDGWFVFRNFDVLPEGTKYFDLTTNKT